MTEAEELELLELEEAEALGAGNTSPEVSKPTYQVPRVPLVYSEGKRRVEESKDLMDRMGYNDPNMIQKSAENALSMVSGGLSKAIPAAGKGAAKFIAPYIEGGTLGAAQSPDDRLGGFLRGGLAQGVTTNVGQALGKLGDVGMQMAVGRKKYTPGVGTQLADEGIFGTKGMMQGQVKDKLAARYQDMQEAAAGIPEINAKTLGQRIGEEATTPYTGGGTVAPSGRDAEAMNTIREFADDVSSRGIETGTQGLARRRAAGSSAYSARSELPKQNLMSQLSKAEQQAYSQALKEAGGEAMVKADTAYGALKRAQKSLNEEASLPRSLMGLASLPAVAVPGVGAATSLVGQGAVKGGRLAEWLAPLVRQSTIPSKGSKK